MGRLRGRRKPAAGGWKNQEHVRQELVADQTPVGIITGVAHVHRVLSVILRRAIRITEHVLIVLRQGYVPSLMA